MNKGDAKGRQERQLKASNPTFEQRFKNKKNAVSKAGLIEVLDQLQPFNLDKKTLLTSDIVHKHPPKVILSVMNKPKSVMDQHEMHREQTKMNPESLKLSDNATPPLIARRYANRDGRLPMISRSTRTLPQKVPTTKNLQNYWQSSLDQKSVRKRRSSELSCLNIMKGNIDVHQQWQALNQFAKLCFREKTKQTKSTDRKPHRPVQSQQRGFKQSFPSEKCID